MITTENGITTIKCDKCGYTNTANEKYYNEIFSELGWVLNKGRKYMHLCDTCISPKVRKTVAWAKQRFGVFLTALVIFIV